MDLHLVNALDELPEVDYVDWCWKGSSERLELIVNEWSCSACRFLLFMYQSY